MSEKSPKQPSARTLSAAASPAKTSQTREGKMGSTETDPGFGGSSLGSLGFFDPDSCSLKMSQRSLFGDSIESLQILPRSGSMLNGRLSARVASAHLTSESACSYSLDTGPENGPRQWPTPTVQDSRNNGGKSQMERNSLPLNAAVGEKATWTPCDCGEYWCNRHGMHAHECECPPLEEWSTNPYERCGKLNPTWVEWLMGFPIEWTACSA